MYEYKATVWRVVDGDTIDIDIDLGFRITVRQRCRLRGLNCPEKRGETKEAGIQATRFTEQWLGGVAHQSGATYAPIVIRSSKPYADDKYGRFLVDVFYDTTGKNSLNEALIASGNAVPYMVNE